MRRLWIMLGIALLASALAIGAIACSSNDNGDNGGTTPEATEQMEPTEMQATEPAGEEPTEAMTDNATVLVTDGVLTDADGNTLYVFDDDEPGISNCFESCSDNWPALAVDGEPTAGEGVTGTLSTITRQDGVTQVTYDDQPLYSYAGDSAPGDRNGDGIGGVWHVAMP